MLHTNGGIIDNGYSRGAQEHRKTGAQEHRSTGAKEHRSTGVLDHKTTELEECRSTQVHKYTSTWVHEYTSTQVHEYRSSGDQKFRSTGVQEFRSTGVLLGMWEFTVLTEINITNIAFLHLRRSTKRMPSNCRVWIFGWFKWTCPQSGNNSNILLCDRNN